MSAFAKGLSIEARGNAVLVPYMKTLWPDAQVWHVPSNIRAQERGDFRVTHPGKGVEYIETKAEMKWTGRLFLETWSDKSMHRAGWLYTSRADWLWYYFLDTNRLYTAQMADIKQWLYGSGERNYAGNLERFAEVKQRKYQQDNDTYGRIVPIDALYECRSFQGPINPKVST